MEKILLKLKECRDIALRKTTTYKWLDEHTREQWYIMSSWSKFHMEDDKHRLHYLLEEVIKELEKL